MKPSTEVRAELTFDRTIVVLLVIAAVHVAYVAIIHAVLFG